MMRNVEGPFIDEYLVEALVDFYDKAAVNILKDYVERMVNNYISKRDKLLKERDEEKKFKFINYIADYISKKINPEAMSEIRMRM